MAKKEVSSDSLESSLLRSADLKKYSPTHRDILIDICRLFDADEEPFTYKKFIDLVPDELYSMLLEMYPGTYTYSDIERFFSDDGIQNKKKRSLEIIRTSSTDRLRTNAILTANPEDAAKISKLFDKDQNANGFQITINGGTNYLQSPPPVLECPHCHLQFSLEMVDVK